MSETKYVVPEGGLNAAWQAVAAKMKERVEAVGKSSVAELHVARIALEAFIRWQSENPREPTEEQTRSLYASARGAVSPYWVAHDSAVEWQRRMYIASESEFDATLGGALQGRTWTQEQADALIENIKTATHGYVESDSFTHLVREGRTLCGLTKWGMGNVDIKFGIERGITTCLKCLRAISLESLSKPVPPKADVQEEIKDLLLPNIESGYYHPGVVNERLAEAFRRGKAEKETK